MQSPQSSAPLRVTLTYDQENGRRLSPPKQVVVDVAPDLGGLLARAAAFNRSDATPLSFTSLLVAMVTGHDPISTWTKAELERHGTTPRKIGARKGTSFDENALAGEVMPPSLPLGTTSSARRAIEQAQAIAQELESGPLLDARHVAAAYPILRDWHDSDFADLGIDRLAWCRAFGAHMAKMFPAEKAYWRTYADRASPVPLTSFSADVYTEKDLLGIDRGVDALALLIASTRTDTPLSIGVFGPWGSGKTFFMRHLRRRIWSLAEREQNRVSAWIAKREAGKAKPEDSPLYFGQVAQVEFNAWHYNEGNLVASLVDHLFRNLRVLPGKKDAQLEQRRTEVLARIDDAKQEAVGASTAFKQAQQELAEAQSEVRRVTEEAAQVRKEVEAKTKELKDSTAEAENAREQLDAAIAQLAAAPDVPSADAILAVALNPLGELALVRETKQVYSTFTQAVGSWREIVPRLLSPTGLIALALCVAAPAVASMKQWLDATSAALAGALGTVVAVVTHVIAFVNERRKEFDAKMRELEAAEAARLQREEAALRAKHEAAQAEWKRRLAGLRTALEEQRAALTSREATVASAVRVLEARSRELEEKERQRGQAEEKRRELEAQLKRLSSALLLDEFLKDRSGTDDYRKQLSLLALVRRDFERLSELIAAANEEWCSPEQKSPPPLLNRIVLYIDDLDRCKPDTVLQVLEAVHLLLAFPLFVCVVAVDPRWVEDCLQQKHSRLFLAEGNNGDARVTVGDYLEKIFQIPIWMRPIESRQRAAVVKALLGSTAAPEARNATTGTGGTSTPEPRETRTTLPTAADSHGDGFQVVVNKAAETPDPLRITREEALFVDRVAPLLSDKPRALKRFVNTYRLLKASLPDIDRETFVSDDPSSPHKLCLSQLALFTGLPRLAPQLVRKLERAKDGDLKLRGWFDALPEAERAPLEGAMRLIPDGEQISLHDFCAWLPDTSRYLFHRED